MMMIVTVVIMKKVSMSVKIIEITKINKTKSLDMAKTPIAGGAGVAGVAGAKAAKDKRKKMNIMTQNTTNIKMIVI